ncbi:MAG: 3'(2'),5'-bisphosphate nucleotidase CysQ [Bacteroidota bacterium]
MKDILSIALEASEAILDIYKKNETHVNYKADDSPLTQADRNAHKIIFQRLKENFPEIPVLSEEGNIPDYDERKSWDEFWLVDPLDGTKEFIKRSGEFTVNIALIKQGKPVSGIVHVPVQGLSYFTDNQKAYRLKGNDFSRKEQIHTRKTNTKHLIIAGSRDHAGAGLQSLLKKNPQATLKSMGSSLKFCMVAMGEADIYYRDLPTMEWDTAAAQAVVEAAGGIVMDDSGKPLTYNKKSVKNPCFIALGDKDFEWKKIF